MFRIIISEAMMKDEINAIVNAEVKFIAGNKKSISHGDEGHEYIIFSSLLFI